MALWGAIFGSLVKKFFEKRTSLHIVKFSEFVRVLLANNGKTFRHKKIEPPLSVALLRICSIFNEVDKFIDVGEFVV